MEEKRQRALTVSAALSLVNTELDALPLVIEGEVSQVSNKPGYKAVYFTIKDKNACLPCMMWMNRFNAAKIDLRVGALVRVAGKLSIYAAKGTMNFTVQSLSLAGEGDLRLKIAQLAQKLAQEGLTSQERKRLLPVYPEIIGLVTSPRGAAVHDVLRTLRRRYPSARVVLAGVPVEGVEAPRNMMMGMKEVVDAGAQLVLLVRGGGSFEDLMPFNDEHLARTIARCPVPVVTGIGHEPDTTIADLVADLRCSTPTAAAEAVSPNEGYLDELLMRRAAQFEASLDRRIHAEGLRLKGLETRPLFKDPQALFSQAWMGIDYGSERLGRAIPANLARDAQTLSSAQQRLARASKSGFERFESQLSLASAQMHSLSPLAVLGRGYAIAYDQQGKVLKSVEGVNGGDHISVRVNKGTIACSVDAVCAENEE